jgi:hypothetical protein
LTKINKDKVALAWEAATHALSNDDAHDWVRSSVLFERAYYLGLMIGLSAIGEEEDVTPLALSTVVDNRLMWARSGDDTYESTSIGQIFRGIREEFDKFNPNIGIDPQGIQRLIQEINRFICEIDHLDREWLNCVQQARILLSEMKSTINGFQDSGITIGLGISDEIKKDFSQINANISTLSNLARYISLVQTHHEMSKRLGI